MTLVWGRPLLSGGRVVTAELAGLAVDQCTLIEERFTLIAPDDYRQDLLEIALFDGRARELARESLYEDEEDEDEDDEEADQPDAGDARWWEFSMSARSSRLRVPAARPVQMSLFDVVSDLQGINIDRNIAKKGPAQLELGLGTGFEKAG